MSLKITSQPASEPVTLAEVKLHLRLESDYTTEDDALDRYIQAAREYCEGFQRRAYISTTYEMYLDSFPAGDAIKIPVNPLISVTSVNYYDTDDTEATMSSDDYLVETDNYESQISLKYGKNWPSTTLRPHRGVIVTFVAGYGADATYTPESVKQSVLLLVGDYYANRCAGNASKSTIEAVERLLWLERCF
jgi:uncharacterized phiE125 gp8 family phage protein